MRSPALALTLGLCAAASVAQPAAKSAPDAAAGRVFTLTGVTIHTVSGPDIPIGAIVVRDGKIASVSADPGAETEGLVIHGKGQHVYPSLFPPMTILGLSEIGAVRATIDASELGDINPDSRADVAVNFDSELLPVARSGGILLAGVTPTGGIVSGSAAAMKMDGWTREDAALKAPAAITVAWPDLRIDRSPTAKLSARLQEKKRDEAVKRLKDAFRDARAYAKARAAEGQPGIPRHDADPKLAALAPAVEGRIPVIVAANWLDQIRDAVAWGREENLRIVIWGGADAWRIADELAKARIPVIVDSPLELPQREDEAYDTQFANAGRLERAGVRVLFNDGGGDASNVRNYPHQAAAAVAFGFPREKAIAAMTLEPATLLGVADRVGSLSAGKDATFIVTDGDILDLRSHVVAAYLDGRALDLTDKQKRLYEKYRNRPKAAGKP
jgi:imidazolonepropionase-like amidohydrolase